MDKTHVLGVTMFDHRYYIVTWFEVQFQIFTKKSVKVWVVYIYYIHSRAQILNCEKYFANVSRHAL